MNLLYVFLIYFLSTLTFFCNAISEENVNINENEVKKVNGTEQVVNSTNDNDKAKQIISYGYISVIVIMAVLITLAIIGYKFYQKSLKIEDDDDLNFNYSIPVIKPNLLNSKHSHVHIYNNKTSGMGSQMSGISQEFDISNNRNYTPNQPMINSLYRNSFGNDKSTGVRDNFNPIYGTGNLGDLAISNSGSVENANFMAINTNSLYRNSGEMSLKPYLNSPYKNNNLKSPASIKSYDNSGIKPIGGYIQNSEPLSNMDNGHESFGTLTNPSLNIKNNNVNGIHNNYYFNGSMNEIPFPQSQSINNVNNMDKNFVQSYLTNPLPPPMPMFHPKTQNELESDSEISFTDIDLDYKTKKSTGNHENDSVLKTDDEEDDDNHIPNKRDSLPKGSSSSTEINEENQNKASQQNKNTNSKASTKTTVTGLPSIRIDKNTNLGLGSPLKINENMNFEIDAPMNSDSNRNSSNTFGLLPKYGSSSGSSMDSVRISISDSSDNNSNRKNSFCATSPSKLSMSESDSNLSNQYTKMSVPAPLYIPSNRNSSSNIYSLTPITSNSTTPTSSSSTVNPHQSLGIYSPTVVSNPSPLMQLTSPRNSNSSNSKDYHRISSVSATLPTEVDKNELLMESNPTNSHLSNFNDLLNTKKYISNEDMIPKGALSSQLSSANSPFVQNRVMPELEKGEINEEQKNESDSDDSCQSSNDDDYKRKVKINNKNNVMAPNSTVVTHSTNTAIGTKKRHQQMMIEDQEQQQLQLQQLNNLKISLSNIEKNEVVLSRSSSLNSQRVRQAKRQHSATPSPNKPESFSGSFISVSEAPSIISNTSNTLNGANVVIVNESKRHSFTSIGDEMDKKSQQQPYSIGMMESQKQVYDGNVNLIESQKHLYNGNISVIESQKQLYDGNVSVIESQKHLFNGNVSVIESKRLSYDGNVSVIESNRHSYDGTVNVIESKRQSYDGKVSVIESNRHSFNGSVSNMESKRESFNSNTINIVESQVQTFDTSPNDLSSSINHSNKPYVKRNDYDDGNSQLSKINPTTSLSDSPKFNNVNIVTSPKTSSSFGNRNPVSPRQYNTKNQVSPNYNSAVNLNRIPMAVNLQNIDLVCGGKPVSPSMTKKSINNHEEVIPSPYLKTKNLKNSGFTSPTLSSKSLNGKTNSPYLSNKSMSPNLHSQELSFNNINYSNIASSAIPKMNYLNGSQSLSSENYYTSPTLSNQNIHNNNDSYNTTTPFDSNLKVKQRSNNSYMTQDHVYKVIVPWYPQYQDEIEINNDDLVNIKKYYEDGYAYGYNITTNQSGIFPISSLSDFENRALAYSPLIVNGKYISPPRRIESTNKMNLNI